MKVTFLLRPDGGLFFGGAEVQALETASALRRQGIEVEIMSPTTKEVGDVVHAFGHYPSYVSTMNYCKARGIPFVLSTIFYREYPLSLMKLRDKYRASKRHNPMWITRQLMRSASALLPNTQAEANQVSELFLKSPVPTFVVPNGAEARFAEGDARLFRERFGIEGPFILNVARIEKRKNQLRLIEAVQGTGMKLVMIGKEAQDDYSRACRAKAEGDADITFLPPIPHDDPLLASAYAAAKVFALPSLLETPGIAALEASLAGARVVITPVGGAREYFGDKAWYVESRSTDSIRQALQAAWNAPDDGGALQRHVLARYTWDAVGTQTAEVYRQALAMAGRTAS